MDSLDRGPVRPIAVRLMQTAGVIVLGVALIYLYYGEPTHAAAVAVVGLAWMIAARLL